MRLKLFDVQKLTEKERKDFSSRFLELMNEDYINQPADYIEKVFFSKQLSLSKGCLLIDEANEIQGFQIISSLPIDIGGNRFVVIQSIVQKSKSLKHKHRSFEKFGPYTLLKQALIATIKGRKPWLIATSEGPATYHRMSAYFKNIIPSSNTGSSPQDSIIKSYNDLAKKLGFQLGLKYKFSIRQAHSLIVSEEERSSWLQRREPDIQRYIAECPEFGKGQKLLFAVPLNFKTIFSIPITLLNQLWIKRKRSIKG